MEGEKINILGRTVIHYEKRIKSPNFEPHITDLRAINRRYWTIKRRINAGFIVCFTILFVIIASLTPVYIGKIKHICDSVICMNNGICSKLNGTCLCQTQEYYGDSCQYSNPCWLNNCSNSGTCDYDLMLNNYTCTCLDGYNGTYCQNYYSCWNSPCEGCIQTEANSTEYECTCSKFNSLTCKSEIKQPLGISFASVYLNDGRLASSFDDYSIKIFSDILTFKNYSTILTGHTDLIKTLVQLEHDVLASGSCDSAIKLWNLTTMSLIKTLQNHTGSINALLKVKLDNGQTYLISGSQDSTVNLWFGKKLIKKINNHSEPIKALVYFDKYNYLAIGSQNKIIRLLEFKNHKGKLLKSFKQIHGIYKFAILPNGNLVGSSNTTIKIWNSTSFELISNLFGHSDFIIALAVLPNSNIVSGSLDLTIKIWQSEYPYDCFAILTAHTGGVNTLAILPNKNIVSGSSDSTIKIWQSEYPYKLIANLTGHTGKIYALAILPNTNIVSCGSDWTIKIWNSTCFKLITTLYNKESYDVYTLAILPDSNILSGCHDGSLKIWNSTSYKLITTLTGHTDSIIALAILPNSYIISAGYEVKIWNSTIYQLIVTLDESFNGCIAFALIPNTNNIVIADRDENIKILQIEQISVNISQFTILKLESDLTALTCFNYIYLIIALSNGIIKIWNIAYTQSLITFSSGHQQEITCLISINNLYFATGSMDKSIFIWKTLDYSNYTISSKLTKHKGRINSLLYISKRKYLVSASSDTSIIIWKHLHANLTMQKDLENAHSRQINDLIQLRNTNFLVSASDDFTIKIWDTNNRYSNIDILIGHTSDVYSIIELPHNRFASCSKDKSIIIWNSTDFQLIKYLFAHLGPVVSLATIGDQYLASGSCDSTIIIWILTNEYQVEAILKGHTDCINVIHYISNKNYLLSGSNDQTVIVWNSLSFTYIKTLDKFSESVYSISSLKFNYVFGLKNNQILIYRDYYTNIATFNTTARINALAILPDKNNVVSGSRDTIRISQSEYPYKLIAKLKGHSNDVNALAILPNKNIVSGSSDSTIKIWNSTSFQLITTLTEQNDITALAILPNTNIVSGSSDSTIKIWQSEYPYKLIANLKGHTNIVTSLAILSNKNIVSGSWDTTIKIWQSDYPYKLIDTLHGHSDWVNALVILPNTNSIVSGSHYSDANIKIWESEYPYKIIANLFTELRISTFSLTILPNSNIVSGSSTAFRNVINIWNSTSFQLITTLYGHTDFIHALAVLPNTNNIISASWDNTVKIWHLKELGYYSNLTEHTDSINDLVFLNNGDLASCSKDKTIRVWDMNSLQTKYLNKEHTRSCLSLTQLNNNNLASTSEDKSIKIWNTNLFYNISIIRGYFNDNNKNKDIIKYKKVSKTKMDALNNLKACSNYFDQNDLMNGKLLEAFKYINTLLND